MKQSILEASEALQKWEGMIWKKTGLFRQLSSNSEVEATWASLINWPHKMSKSYSKLVYKATLSFILTILIWVVAYFEPKRNFKKIAFFIKEVLFNFFVRMPQPPKSWKRHHQKLHRNTQKIFEFPNEIGHFELLCLY